MTVACVCTYADDPSRCMRQPVTTCRLLTTLPSHPVRILSSSGCILFPLILCHAISHVDIRVCVRVCAHCALGLVQGAIRWSPITSVRSDFGTLLVFVVYSGNATGLWAHVCERFRRWPSKIKELHAVHGAVQ